MSQTTADIEKKHEEFKSQLVDDVFGKDNKGKVQMEKVTMLIWQFRDDPSVVKFMAQFVARYSSSRDVFDGIEFYLPQLAHMIIHLEVNWDDAILERFALVIAQQSLHFALQLTWIILGAIEDYQPEKASGEPNPSHNPLFYSRCIKLLANIERCVAVGKPRSHELQRLFESGNISKEEYEILERADRRFNAAQIAAESRIESEHVFGGVLLYKPRVRLGCCQPKRWDERYFAVDDRILYCYESKESKELIRSMPLEGAAVEDVKGGKYPLMFQVSNREYHFIMRAQNTETKDDWVKKLKEESKVRPPFDATASAATTASLLGIEDLTEAQRARFDFYKNERKFIRDLTDVAERLRFKERDERKEFAPGYMAEVEVPASCYIPLVNSTDIWRRVDQILSKETKVFNTNERCPTLMYFVTKRGEKLYNQRGGLKDVNLDVVEYMHIQYDLRDLDAIEEENADGLHSRENSVEKLDEVESKDEGEEVALGAPEEKKEQEDDDDDDEKQPESSGGSSTVWFGDDNEHNEEGSAEVKSSNVSRKGNKQVQRFMREGISKMPSKLLNRIETRRSIRTATKSINDVKKRLSVTVPIIEEKPSQDDDSADDSSVVSVQRSSIISKSGGFKMGEIDEGVITKGSIDKAKQVVCNGEGYADKTARMLRDVDSEKPEEDPEVQREIVSFIAKSNDDLRQEVFVMQMIHYYKSVFANAKIPVWLKTYRILSTSQDTGLIELITDATSIDGLKKAKAYPEEGGLRAYFEQVYGKPDTASFKAAQTNFTKSLAAYSVVSYLLGLKDRHNGNIMIDTRGYLIFIDFGFAFGMAPGHEFSMERAPFKLTKDYLDVMGGVNSECFKEFQRLFLACFTEARKNSQIAIGLVEIMMYKSNYPCFTGSRYGNGKARKTFEKRLMLNVPEKKVEKKALKLISKSMKHLGTYLYDVFQQHSNGYAI